MTYGKLLITSLNTADYDITFSCQDANVSPCNIEEKHRYFGVRVKGGQLPQMQRFMQVPRNFL